MSHSSVSLRNWLLLGGALVGLSISNPAVAQSITATSSASSVISTTAQNITNAGTANYVANVHLFLDAASGAGTKVVLGTSAGATSVLDLTTATTPLQITDLKGTSQFEFNSWPAARVEFSDGTNAAPITTNNPTVKVSRTEQLPAGACGGNTNDTECNSALSLVSVGLANTVNVTSGLNVVAKTSSTVAGASAQGANIHGRANAGSTSTAQGAYIEGMRNATTAAAIGAEITAWNNTTTDCVVGNTTPGNCDGIWVTSRALQPTNYDATAVHIGLGDVNSAWLQGITINDNSVINFSYNDRSSSTTSLHVGGTHTHALLIDAAAGDISTAGAITVTGGSAPSLSNGTGYAIATATQGLVLGGQGSANAFNLVNSDGTSVLSVAPHGTALFGNSINLNAQASVVSGAGGFGGTATNGADIVGSGSSNDVTVRNKNGTAVWFIGTGSLQTFFQGAVSAPSHISTGTTFTIASGCGTPGSLTGGASTGSFTAGQIACAPVINLPTAPHGWWCLANDITTTADLLKQTATSASSCTLSGTVVNGDTIVFHAEGY